MCVHPGGLSKHFWSMEKVALFENPFVLLASFWWATPWRQWGRTPRMTCSLKRCGMKACIERPACSDEDKTMLATFREFRVCGNAFQTLNFELFSELTSISSSWNSSAFNQNGCHFAQWWMKTMVNIGENSTFIIVAIFNNLLKALHFKIVIALGLPSFSAVNNRSEH